MTDQPPNNNITTENNDNDNLAAAYSWEEAYKRSWDIIQEDLNGTINTNLLKTQQKLKKRLRTQQQVQRGILRNLYIIIDLSSSMFLKDFKPSYFELTLKLLKLFVAEFFDSNPISCVGVIVTGGIENGKSLLLSEKNSNLLEINKVFNDLQQELLVQSERGQVSIQNSLEICLQSLKSTPKHSSREVLFVFASLASRDYGDVGNIIKELKNEQVRVNVLSLQAEVQIMKILSKETGGCHYVPLNEDHYKDLLFEFILPPALSDTDNAAFLVYMGFPSKINNNSSLCSCHQKLTTNGFICPRCNAKVCLLPSDCYVCDLKLISAPHLARSYHHLFPVEVYDEVELKVSKDSGLSCFGCLTEFVGEDVNNSNNDVGIKIKISLSKGSSNANIGEMIVQCLRCKKCKNVFCLDCDKFIHEILHTCPGCS